MRELILSLALFTLAPALSLAAPPVEDEARRLDRLETKRLNERAAAHQLAPGASTFGQYEAPAQAASPATAEEAALRRRELDAIAAWRQQVELCRRNKNGTC